MIKLLKIEGEPGYAKDPENKAVLNIDSRGLTSYKNARERRRQREKEIEELNDEVRELRDIVDLLKKALLNGTANN